LWPYASIMRLGGSTVLATLEVRVPQMGEGLQEVVVAGFFKQVGDHVTRDEPLYSMETDKAVMDVESPFEGTVVRWLAQPGEVLPVGAPIAVLEGADLAVALSADIAPVAGDVSNSGTSVDFRSGAASRIPPRTRAYCKELGISQSAMMEMKSATGKLMPADVDANIANISRIAIPEPRLETAPQPRQETPVVEAGTMDVAVSRQQRVLISRMRRSLETVIPASMSRELAWGAIEKYVKQRREADYNFRATDFQSAAWCVARAVAAYPQFRWSMVNDETIRKREQLNLGIAVALPGGDLLTAAVRNADVIGYEEFVDEAQAAIALAREGKDQASADIPMHITYLGAHGILNAIPLLISLASSVLFIGAVYKNLDGNRVCNVTLTFDHRMYNGAEAALLLAKVAENAAEIDSIAG